MVAGICDPWTSTPLNILGAFIVVDLSALYAMLSMNIALHHCASSKPKDFQ